jgi:hypothetical protein
VDAGDVGRGVDLLEDRVQGTGVEADVDVARGLLGSLVGVDRGEDVGWVYRVPERLGDQWPEVGYEFVVVPTAR